MSDPSHIFEGELAASDQVLKLQQDKKDLREAISHAQDLMRQMQTKCQRLHIERDRLLERNVEMWQGFRKIKRHWTYRFLPKDLRELISSEAGRAD